VFAEKNDLKDWHNSKRRSGDSNLHPIIRPNENKIGFILISEIYSDVKM
jgi:hypothetical protein